MKTKYIHEYDTFIVKSKNKTPDSFQIKSSTDITDFAHKHIYTPDQIATKEYFYAIYLNQGNFVKGYYRISEGGISCTAVDLRFIIKGALDVLATGVILVHNHPSGRTIPSIHDNNITQKIFDACKVMELVLVDHVIVTPTDWIYYSYYNENNILGDGNTI